MAERIWKFTFPIAVAATQYLPRGAKPMSVGMDPSNRTAIAVWARCEADAPYVRHKFEVRGTGDACPEGAEFIGTVVDTVPGYVWHVFDSGEEE